MILFAAQDTLGRVGETKSEVEMRYSSSGLPSSRDDLGNEQELYNFRNFLVAVSFQNDRSVCETFMKLGGSKTGFSLSPDEIGRVLNANEGEGRQWKTRIESISWESSDGKLQAISLFGRLQISTSAFSAQMRAFHEKRERYQGGRED
ncbi:MAG TPA: hypothetical protein VGF73_11425 [Chthoniobacterales bacterium]